MLKTHDSRDPRCPDRAVSPVIGVVLMVAITVILASVIGTFVLDMGRNAGQTAPQASLSVTIDAASNNLTIEHAGGDALDAAETRVLIEHVNGSTITFDPASASSTLTVGHSVALSVNDGTAGAPWTGLSGNGGGFGIESGQRVQVTIVDVASQRQIFQTTVTA
ncbi:MAG: type IV pilin [Halobacteriales archaeon]